MNWSFRVADVPIHVHTTFFLILLLRAYRWGSNDWHIERRNLRRPPPSRQRLVTPWRSALCWPCWSKV